MEAETSFERKPIHIAAIRGQEEIMSIFINKGVDLNV